MYDISGEVNNIGATLLCFQTYHTEAFWDVN
jgi:hypothetical protein